MSAELVPDSVTLFDGISLGETRWTAGHSKAL